MGRKKEGFFDLVAGMPWPVGLVLGVVAFFGVRVGVPWFLGQSGGALAQGLAEGARSGPFGWLAWMLLLVFWAAAGASFLGRRQRARLFDDQATNPRLADLDWRRFELLVGEWFRRRGYTVEETGGGGADGGIDLLVRREGRKELVQCKHWKRRRVDVATVREMWGLLQHHRADAVWIVCGGGFTPDAARFAEGKAIHLVPGRELEKLIASTPASTPASTRARQEPSLAPDVMPGEPAPQAPPAPVPSAVPAETENCPRCGSPMTLRQNRKTGDAFLGCTAFPRCRETRAVNGQASAPQANPG